MAPQDPLNAPSLLAFMSARPGARGREALYAPAPRVFIILRVNTGLDAAVLARGVRCFSAEADDDWSFSAFAMHGEHRVALGGPLGSRATRARDPGRRAFHGGCRMTRVR